MYEILDNIAIGFCAIFVTFILHAAALDRLYRIIRQVGAFVQNRLPFRTHPQTVILSIVGLGIIALHSIEIWIWALLYLWLDIAAVISLENALYYSATSFSTVGYGDLVLDPSWRRLGSMQAASGMILFGWSTAFIFEMIRLNYRDED